MSPKKEEPVTYVRIQLVKESLDEDSRERLTKRGVQCLEEGGAFEAYGIIPRSEILLDSLATDPSVASVEKKDPPCCK